MCSMSSSHLDPLTSQFSKPRPPRLQSRQAKLRGSAKPSANAMKPSESSEQPIVLEYPDVDTRVNLLAKHCMYIETCCKENFQDLQQRYDELGDELRELRNTQEQDKSTNHATLKKLRDELDSVGMALHDCDERTSATRHSLEEKVHATEGQHLVPSPKKSFMEPGCLIFYFQWRLHVPQRSSKLY